MRHLVTQTVEVESLEHAFRDLPKQGRLAETQEGLIYLDIDDNFIHRAYPVLEHLSVAKPPYFDIEHHGVGAHISIFYPEEANVLQPEDWGRSHDFAIQKLVAADLNDTRYYVLLVHAPSLARLRIKYGYPKKLSFKGHSIDFHITLATRLSF